MMTKLEQLIEQLCPDGVECMKIGEFAKCESSKNKNQRITLAYSITKGGLIPTSEYFKDAKVTSENTSGYRIVKKNWFVYSPSRIDVGSINYLKEDITVIVSPLNVVFSIDEKKIIPDYLLYFLQSRKGTWQILTSREGIEGTGRKLLPFEKFAKILVPVPPLEVQAEIVRILDTFTELTTELTTELINRKKQYEYYRDDLLSFDVDIPKKKLGDTCLLKAGNSIPSNEIADTMNESTPIPCYGGNGIRGYVKKPNKHGEYPLIGRQGALCGNVQYAKGDFYATEHAVVVSSEKAYIPRFLYHLLVHMNLNQYKSAGAQPGLAVKNLQELFAPVPSIEIQERIVDVLDNFEAICSDLNIGLPAEIEARQKQYEYYRDKLLTFKEL